MSDGDVRSVGRALSLLLAFSVQQPEMMLTELSHELGLSVSTTHRLLSTLKSYQFIEQDQTSAKYRLGVALFKLGAAAQPGMALSRHSEGPLRELARQTAETAYVCTILSNAALCIARVESQHPVRVLALDIGGQLPLNCGGAPRMLMASLPDDEIDRLLQEDHFKRMTPHSLVEPDAIWDDIRLTRERGYSFSVEDVIEGVAAVGAPILDHTGNIIAAMSVAGILPHFGPDRLPAIVAAVKRQAEIVSESLGWVQPANPETIKPA